MKLSIRPADFDTAAPFLAIHHERADTTSGAVTIAEACRSARCFVVADDTGQDIAAYALELLRHDCAAVAWVRAAGGRLPGFNLVASVLPTIEAQARAMGADQIAFTTRRRGLVRSMLARGYRMTAVTMRMPLCS